MICVLLYLSDSSVTDWIQAIASAVGIPLLIYTLIQGNKNNQLQVRALRNTTRPIFTLLSLSESKSFRKNNDDEIPVVINVNNNDAIDLTIEGISTQHIKFEQYKLLIPRFSVSAKCPIQFKVIPFSPEEQANFKHPNEMWIKLGVKIKLSYSDENGYQYSQEITGLPNSQFLLEQVVFK